jgi:hypothetical protein
MNQARGNNGTFAVAHDNTMSLMMELDRLCNMIAHMERGERCEGTMTQDQTRWLIQVIRERPSWALPTLGRYGYLKA